MPGTFFGPFSSKDEDHAEPAGGNTGRFPLGHYLITPDGRKYRYTLNDATAEVAGDLYQSVALVANHQNRAADVARAVAAVVISASIAGTAAGTDIYNEGVVHINDVDGQGYAYRVRRARASGDGHASAAGTDILTVNLESDESVQVALTTNSQMSFTRNRFREALLHPSPPTARLAGVSPGVAAANRYYWSQVAGEAACLADGTILEGAAAQASITVDGAVESAKRRMRTSGSSVVMSPNFAIEDQDGNVVNLNIGSASGDYDITGPVAINAPLVGACIQTNASTEYALVDLLILGS